MIDCAGASPDIVAGLGASIDKLVGIRKEVDAALPVPFTERRPNIAGDFNSAITDLINRLERMSKVVGEKVRMADAETAELIEVKELAWLARDGVGLERTVLIDGMNARALSPAMQKRATELRARAEVTWTVVRELTGRPGVPVEVVDAVKVRTRRSSKPTRRCAWDHVALTTGQAPPVSVEELVARSNVALDLSWRFQIPQW